MTALPILQQPRPRLAPEPTIEWSPAQRDQVARELASAISGEVRFGLHDRMLYSTDASLYQVEPLGVVIPASVDDALAAAQFCHARGLPILPRGGGTSLAGQCTSRAVVLDFSPNCREILELDATSQRVRVEPGITVDDLNEELARRGTGLFFAPDPATARQANIGGCIGNNAAGSHSILYGRTAESLLGVDAIVLSAEGARRVRLDKGASDRDPFVRDLTLQVAQVVRDHESLIRERFPKTIRRNAGYALDMVLAAMDAAGPNADADEILRQINLAHLVCGSEGTLAITVGAELKLHPRPKASGLALVGFESLEAAIDAVVPILALKPSAVEMLDDTILDLARANSEYKKYVELMPQPASGPLKAILYVEFYAFGDPATAAAEVQQKFRDLATLIPTLSPTARVANYTSPKDMAPAWKLRKAGEPLLHGMPGERKPITFVEDNAVPVENLARFVREFKQIVQRKGTGASFWAHASVGVLHVRPFLSIRDPLDRHIMQEIAAEVADLAKRCGGVMSGEHGDGKVRGPLLERYFGPELMNAFRQIKAIFDPKNLLNPGNVVAPGDLASITERVRVKPRNQFVTVPDVDTYYDYEDQHGFSGAVEMCNGAGVCRKKSGGTMCPSYMGTLDERHSTRGRGNALRLAITGQLNQRDAASERGEGSGSPSWSDPETIKTLDLCLSCKACKTECPSNVDIARLKAEYTAQRYRAEGKTPLKARVFGHVRTLNRLGSIAPSLANAVNSLAPMRWLVSRVLGIAPQRHLPRFCEPFTKAFARWRTASPPPLNAPRVAIYNDCFTGFNDNHIGLAAARVLTAFGYRVELIDAGCCGRAAMSMGLLEDARTMIDNTLTKLAAAASDPHIAAILVLEPSCLSAIKDDWLQLKLATQLDTREVIAAKSFLAEDFLDRNWDRHPTRPAIAPSDQPIYLHGHCHQKALWSAETSAGLLRRLVGDRLKVLDTTCCGMAGSFGYAADKYDLSMKIAEHSLFPAIRAAQAAGSCAIAAPGTSCRHQIDDGLGIHADHPIELADRLLKR